MEKIILFAKIFVLLTGLNYLFGNQDVDSLSAIILFSVMLWVVILGVKNRI